MAQHSSYEVVLVFLYMNKYIVKVLCVVVIFLGYLPLAQADTMTDLQLQIEKLQALLITLQQQQNQTQKPCVELTSSLSLGSSDATSGGQVSKLQQFLRATSHFNYPTLTGYYGSVTAAAVTSWQTTNRQLIGVGNISYGSIDQPTREAMAKGCQNDGVATAEILTTSPISPIMLPDRVWGERLLNFQVDAVTSTALSDVTVNIDLPFIKAGDFRDLIDKVSLVSDASQYSIEATTVSDNGITVSLAGVTHDSVTAHFEIPSDAQKYFAIKAADDAEFYIVVDFKKASELGTFGDKKSISEGYIRAGLAEIQDAKGVVIPISTSSYSNNYGPMRLLQSKY